MALSNTPEEYKERLLTTLRNDSAITGRRIAFWQKDLADKDYTDAQIARLTSEIAEEQRLQNVIDALAAMVEDVDTSNV